MDARTAVQRIVDAQTAIDDHDSDSTPAPYELLEGAMRGLAELDVAERARVIELLADPDVRIRCTAAQMCATLKLDANAALLAGITDPSETFREACGAALVAIAPDTALIALVDSGAPIAAGVLCDAATAAVTALGLDALGWIEQSGLAPYACGEPAWNALYALDPEATTRAMERGLARGTFAWAEGVHAHVIVHGGDWARPAFEVLAQSHDPAISRAATNALAAVGGTTTIASLLKLLDERSHMWGRGEAITAVFAVGRRTATPVAARVIPLVKTTAYDQILLMTELGQLEDATWEAGARDAITDAIRFGLGLADRNPVGSAILAAAALRLESLADDVVATPWDLSWYENALPDSRLAYAQAVGVPAFAAATSRIEAALAGTGDVTTASYAVSFLAHDTDPSRPVALLRRALASSSSDLRTAPADALGRLGALEAADELLACARDAPPGEAYRAVQALEWFRDPRVVAVALARLEPVLAGGAIGSNEQAWLHGSAMRVLGTLGGATARDGLRRALTHADVRMRRDAAAALGQLGDTTAVPWLEPLRNDGERQVRRTALRAIRRLTSARS